MKCIESAKKITALAVAFTFALSPVPASFAGSAQIDSIGGQSVPVVNPETQTQNPDLAAHVASGETQQATETISPLSVATSTTASIAKADTANLIETARIAENGGTKSTAHDLEIAALKSTMPETITKTETAEKTTYTWAASGPTESEIAYSISKTTPPTTTLTISGDLTLPENSHLGAGTVTITGTLQAEGVIINTGNTSLSNVTQIATGSTHSFALLSDGTVQGWSSTTGSIGFGTLISSGVLSVNPQLLQLNTITSQGGTLSDSIIRTGTTITLTQTTTETPFVGPIYYGSVVLAEEKQQVETALKINSAENLVIYKITSTTACLVDNDSCPPDTTDTYRGARGQILGSRSYDAPKVQDAIWRGADGKIIPTGSRVSAIPAEIFAEAATVLGQTPDPEKSTVDMGKPCEMEPCRQSPITYSFVNSDGKPIGKMVKIIGYNGDIESGNDTIQWFNAENVEIDPINTGMPRGATEVPAEELDLVKGVFGSNVKYQIMTDTGCGQGDILCLRNTGTTYYDARGNILGFRKNLINNQFEFESADHTKTYHYGDLRGMHQKGITGITFNFQNHSPVHVDFDYSSSQSFPADFNAIEAAVKDFVSRGNTATSLVMKNYHLDSGNSGETNSMPGNPIGFNKMSFTLESTETTWHYAVTQTARDNKYSAELLSKETSEQPAVAAVKAIVRADLMKTFGFSEQMLKDLMSARPPQISITVDIEKRTASVMIDPSVKLPEGAVNLFDPLGSNKLPETINYVLGKSEPLMMGVPCTVSATGATDCPKEPDPTYFLESGSFSIENRSFTFDYIPKIKQGEISIALVSPGNNKLHSVSITTAVDQCKGSEFCTAQYVSFTETLTYKYAADGSATAELSHGILTEDGKRPNGRDIKFKLMDDGTYRISEVLEMDGNGNLSIKNEFSYAPPACVATEGTSCPTYYVPDMPPAGTLWKIFRSDAAGKNISTITLGKPSFILVNLDAPANQSASGNQATITLANGKSFVGTYATLNDLLIQALRFETEEPFEKALRQIENVPVTDEAFEKIKALLSVNNISDVFTVTTTRDKFFTTTTYSLKIGADTLVITHHNSIPRKDNVWNEDFAYEGATVELRSPVSLDDFKQLRNQMFDENKIYFDAHIRDLTNSSQIYKSLSLDSSEGNVFYHAQINRIAALKLGMNKDGTIDSISISVSTIGSVSPETFAPEAQIILGQAVAHVYRLDPPKGMMDAPTVYEFYDKDYKLIGKKIDGGMAPRAFWTNAENEQIAFQTQITFAGIANQVFGQMPTYQLSRSSGPVCGADENCPTVMPVRTTYFFDNNFNVIGTFNEDFKTWQNADGKLIAEQKVVSGTELSEMLDILRGPNRRRTLVTTFWKTENQSGDNTLTISYYDEAGQLILTKTTQKPDDTTTVTTWRNAQGNTKQITTVTIYPDFTQTTLQDEMGRTKLIKTVFNDSSRYDGHKTETMEMFYENALSPTQWSRSVNSSYDDNGTLVTLYNQFLRYVDNGNTQLNTSVGYFFLNGVKIYSFQSHVINNDGTTVYFGQSTTRDFSGLITASTDTSTIAALAEYKLVISDTTDRAERQYVFKDSNGNWMSSPSIVQHGTDQYMLTGGNEVKLTGRDPIARAGDKTYTTWFQFPHYGYKADGSYGLIPMGFYVQGNTETIFVEFPKQTQFEIDGKKYQMTVNTAGKIQLTELLTPFTISAWTNTSPNSTAPNLTVKIDESGTADIQYNGAHYIGAFDQNTMSISIEGSSSVLFLQLEKKDNGYVLKSLMDQRSLSSMKLTQTYTYTFSDGGLMVAYHYDSSSLFENTKITIHDIETYSYVNIGGKNYLSEHAIESHRINLINGNEEKMDRSSRQTFEYDGTGLTKTMTTLDYQKNDAGQVVGALINFTRWDASRKETSVTVDYPAQTTVMLDGKIFDIHVDALGKLTLTEKPAVLSPLSEVLDTLTPPLSSDTRRQIEAAMATMSDPTAYLIGESNGNITSYSWLNKDDARFSYHITQMIDYAGNSSWTFMQGFPLPLSAIVDNLTPPLSPEAKAQVDAALLDMTSDIAFTMTKDTNGAVIGYSWTSASNPQKTYQLNQAFDSENNMSWVLMATLPIDTSIPPAISKYVDELKKQVGENILITTSLQNNGVYRVFLSKGFVCPIGMNCMSPAPGSFSSLSFSLSQDGVLDRNSIKADFNGIAVDAKVLFEALFQEPSLKGLVIALPFDSSITDRHFLGEMTKVKINHIDEGFGIIHFEKDGEHYIAYRQGNANDGKIMLEYDTSKTPVDASEIRFLSSIFGFGFNPVSKSSETMTGAEGLKELVLYYDVNGNPLAGLRKYENRWEFQKGSQPSTVLPIAPVDSTEVASLELILDNPFTNENSPTVKATLAPDFIYYFDKKGNNIVIIVPPEHKVIRADGSEIQFETNITLSEEANRMLGQMPTYQLTKVEDSRCAEGATCVWAGTVTHITNYFDNQFNFIGTMSYTELNEDLKIWRNARGELINDSALLPKTAVALSEVEQDLAKNALELQNPNLGILYKTTETTRVNCDADNASSCPADTIKETLYTKDGVKVGFKIISGDQLIFKDAESITKQSLTLVKDPTEIDLVRKILAGRSGAYSTAFLAMWEEIANKDFSAYSDPDDEEEQTSLVSNSGVTLAF